jgi:intracellular sulfur oxidation DsrE/DsrF family protein
MRHLVIALAVVTPLTIQHALAGDHVTPVPAIIPGALPYVPIPGAKSPPDRSHVYKVIFDVTRAAENASRPVDGILFAATDISALRGQGVPAPNTRFALLFHGPSVDGLLNSAAYRAKHGVENPNLAMLAALKQMGVEIMVCGQFLGAMRIDPGTLSPDVAIAAEAYLTLIRYQNDGYAVLQF